MKQQSELLTAFYRAYLAWVENGEGSKYRFRDAVGLCANLNRFLSVEDPTADTLEEMEDQFVQAGLDLCYPFNNGEHQDYQDEMQSHEATSNVQRMKWVRDHAQ